MKLSPSITRLFGALLFTIGAIAGIALVTMLTWANLEADFYSFYTFSRNPIQSLECPALMTRSETNEVTAVFENPTDRTITPNLRVQVSSPGLFRVEESQLSIASGSEEVLVVPVSKADIDLRQFIIVNIYKFPAYQTPPQQSRCGIFVLDVPGLTGEQIYWLLAIGGTALMALGGYLWWTYSNTSVLSNKKPSRAPFFLMSMIILGIIFGSMRIWALSGLILLISIMLVGTIIYIATQN